MRKIYHLSTCNTCQKIISGLKMKEEDIQQDIKTKKIEPDQLDEMARRAGSYEALFSRRARKYRGLGLHEQTLNESDYRKLILEEYTFLKRPVILVGAEQFVGNTAQTVAAAQNAWNDGR